MERSGCQGSPLAWASCGNSGPTSSLQSSVSSYISLTAECCLPGDYEVPVGAAVAGAGDAVRTDGHVAPVVAARW